MPEFIAPIATKNAFPIGPSMEPRGSAPTSDKSFEPAYAQENRRMHKDLTKLIETIKVNTEDIICCTAKSDTDFSN